MTVAVLDQVRDLIEEGRPPERKYGWQRPEDDSLGGQIVAGAAHVASTTCAWLMLVAEFERRESWNSYYGITSTAHFLRWAAGVGIGASREHVRVARTLESMPLICEAFAAGELSYSKVRECTRVVGMVVESELLYAARGMTAAQLETAIREFRRGRADRIEQQLRRKVSWRTEDDGTVIIRAALPAEEAAIVFAALDKATRHDHDAHQPEQGASLDGSANDADSTTKGDSSAEPCDEESPAPRYDKADALVEIARAYCEQAPVDVSGEDRDVVVVHISADDLAAADELTTTDATESNVPAGTSDMTDGEVCVTDSDRPVTLGKPGMPAAPYIAGAGAVTTQTAQRLACVALIQAAVLDKSGEVLRLGRARRLVSPAQRRALMVRDGCCQFPGCTRRRHLQAHHIVFWSLGGATDLANLILLCQRHHTVVHEGSLTISGRPGSWMFTRIGGATITAQHYVRHGALSETLLLDHLLGDLTGIRDYLDPRSEVLFPTWGGAREGMTAGRDTIWTAAINETPSDQTPSGWAAANDVPDETDERVPAGTPW